jgi:hypothetical protein
MLDRHTTPRNHVFGQRRLRHHPVECGNARIGLGRRLGGGPYVGPDISEQLFETLFMERMFWIVREAQPDIELARLAQIVGDGFGRIFVVAGETVESGCPPCRRI